MLKKKKQEEERINCQRKVLISISPMAYPQTVFFSFFLETRNTV